MNIFTIDTYQDNVKNINEKENDYLIELKYSFEDIKNFFNENDPLFNNKNFCSKIEWKYIIYHHKDILSLNFIRKHKEYVFVNFIYFSHFTEEFLDEMWDEFEDQRCLIITLKNTKNLSINFIERRFEDIIEKNTINCRFYEFSIWKYIYNNLKDKNIDVIQNYLLKRILNDYGKKHKPLCSLREILLK